MPMYRARSPLGWFPIWDVAHGTASFTLTNLAASPTITEPATAVRIVRDLRLVQTINLSMQCTTGNVGRIGVQFSLDNGSTWTWLDGTTGTTDTGAAVNAQTLYMNSAAQKSVTGITLAPAARTASTLLRVVAVQGNGSTSPSYRCLSVTAIV